MRGDWLNTAVVGAVYVGLGKTVGLAERGRNTVFVDENPGGLDATACPRIASHEPVPPKVYL
jgi:UDP-glucose 6-dehydrogenase